MARQMKDSGVEWIGEIPEGWAVSKVKYFIDCYDGRRVPVDAGERVSGPYPYWGAGSITDYVDNYLFDEELILLGEDGAPFFDLTRPVAFLVNEKIWVNNHIHVLKPHADVCPAYLLHFLNTVDYKTYINGSILNKLTQSNMNSIAFIVPPIVEQQRIADFLDRRCAEIDAVIECTRATIEEYKKLKQAVITEAVTKGVRGERKMKDSGIEWIGEIPEEWEVLPHKYLMHKEKSICEHYAGEDIISLTMNGVIVRDLTAGGKMPTTFDGYQYVEPDDMLLCLFDIDVTPRCVGIVRNHGVTSPAYSRFKVHVGYYNAYYDYLLRFIDDEKVFIHLSKNLRSSLTETDFGAIKTISPSYDEQVEIAAYLDEKCAALDTLIAKKTALLTELEAYKKSLIYEYVTGKKEVQ